MARNKLKKWTTFLFCVTGIIIIFLGTTYLLWFRRTELPITNYAFSNKNKALEILYNEYKPLTDVKSKGYYKSFLEKDLNMHLYFYAEKELSGYNGLCYPNIRLILIDVDLVGYQYCCTLVHEMMHLKKIRVQENYICFETFKYLYESEELHNIGVWYGIRQLNGLYSGEYNIRYQIVDYLTNK